MIEISSQVALRSKRPGQKRLHIVNYEAGQLDENGFISIFADLEVGNLNSIVGDLRVDPPWVTFGIKRMDMQHLFVGIRSEWLEERDNVNRANAALTCITFDTAQFNNCDSRFLISEIANSFPKPELLFDSSAEIKSEVPILTQNNYVEKVVKLIERFSLKDICFFASLSLEKNISLQDAYLNYSLEERLVLMDAIWGLLPFNWRFGLHRGFSSWMSSYNKAIKITFSQSRPNREMVRLSEPSDIRKLSLQGTALAQQYYDLLFNLIKKRGLEKVVSVLAADSKGIEITAVTARDALEILASCDIAATVWQQYQRQVPLDETLLERLFRDREALAELPLNHQRHLLTKYLTESENLSAKLIPVFRENWTIEFDEALVSRICNALDNDRPLNHYQELVQTIDKEQHITLNVLRRLLGNQTPNLSRFMVKWIEPLIKDLNRLAESNKNQWGTIFKTVYDRDSRSVTELLSITSRSRFYDWVDVFYFSNIEFVKHLKEIISDVHVQPDRYKQHYNAYFSIIRSSPSQTPDWERYPISTTLKNRLSLEFGIWLLQNWTLEITEKSVLANHVANTHSETLRDKTVQFVISLIQQKYTRQVASLFINHEKHLNEFAHLIHSLGVSKSEKILLKFMDMVEFKKSSRKTRLDDTAYLRRHIPSRTLDREYDRLHGQLIMTDLERAYMNSAGEFAQFCRRLLDEQDTDYFRLSLLKTIAIVLRNNPSQGKYETLLNHLSNHEFHSLTRELLLPQDKNKRKTMAIKLWTRLVAKRIKKSASKLQSGIGVNNERP